ncbi:UNVERIFIED_CONTAM: Eukaryotic translation initiation factor 4G [Sesamum angustifolium]|uniref:Eukaryotic translation initiation factor 4G n=1 Tax=Sesamum angustifolium TaxID=2727405 RepID=A0AAW2RJ44_9LAMI
MSHNQSRAERSESTQYRKTGRSGSSNQQRQFISGVSTKGGGGASSAPTNPSNRSSKKYNSNSQLGQPSARNPNVDSSNPPAARAVQNGAHQHQSTHGLSDSPFTNNSSNVKPMDASTIKTTLDVPRAPSSDVSSAAPLSNVSTASSESRAPSTPGKAPGDASKSFPLQFGSISPGFMNGMQVPARTSSAPPNLDEQKKAQARHESLRSAPAMPIPSIPKQHLPKKDAGSREQPNTGDAQLASKSKRDAQVSAAPPVSQAQKPSVHPIPGMTMPLPFHQPPVAVQFGGPNPQIQSQAMSGTSLPMPLPMSLPLGNPPVQHSMFVPGLQPHPMQSQAMMHQGQSLNFSPQMGPIPPQLGSMGINMAPQFPQQPAVKFSGSRKTVKITHPETHEELRLESSPASRLHPNMPSQSQPISSFPPNIPMNFYPNSYNATSLFFPGASSVPHSSTQVPPSSQPPRSYNQVTVKPPSCGEKEPLSSLAQTKPGLAKSYASAASSGPVNVQRDVSHTSTSTLSPVDGFGSASTISADEARTGTVSAKDNHKKLGNRSQQDQVFFLYFIGLASYLPLYQVRLSELAEAEAMEAKSASSGINTVSEAAKESLSAIESDSCEASHLTIGGAMEEKISGESKSLGMKGVNSRQSEADTMGNKDQGEATSVEASKPYEPSLETSLRSLSLESQETTGEIEESSDMEVISTNGDLLEGIHGKPQESTGCYSDDVEVNDNLAASTDTLRCRSTENSVSVTGLSVQNEKTSPDVLSSVANGMDTRETNVDKFAMVDQEHAVLVPSSPKAALGTQDEDIDSNNCGLLLPSPSSVKDNTLSDTNVARSTVPRENKEVVTSADGSEKSSIISEKQTSANVSQDNAAPCGKPTQGKVEPDDWEDAAEISSPQLETLKNENDDKDGDGYGLTTKRYSRDFLLKFVEQCTNLPEGFEITADIADTMMVSSAHVSRQSYPSPGSTIDRTIGGSRPDRRGSGLGDEDKWSKFPGSLCPAEEICGQILAMQVILLGFGLAKEKGLMPSPQTPMPVMHKAEKKYEIFDKALMEPTFCEMYANFCFHLAADLPDLSDENERITFKRLLLNKCQEEFERGEREEEEANKAEEEGEAKQTAEEREEKRLQARRRMLGNIRLIGELYKKRMLTERIMHECINKLLGQYQNPDEENIEALCKLMSTIGEMIDHPKAKEHIDAYFDIMAQLSNNMKLSSRVRFMLKDAIDLRKNKWQQRRKVEGPKKIEEVHRDAAQERQTQASRLGRIPSLANSVRRGPPTDFGPRSAGMLSPPGSQTGAYRAVPPQLRGYGPHHVGMEERHPFENRTMSVPLPQRPLGDDSITLGPQGGLAKGMAYRGQPSASNILLAEMPSPGDARRMGPGQNGYSSMPERAAYGQREDLMPRYMPDRFAAPPNYNHSHAQERNMSHGNREVRNTDSSLTVLCIFLHLLEVGQQLAHKICLRIRCGQKSACGTSLWLQSENSTDYAITHFGS